MKCRDQGHLAGLLKECRDRERGIRSSNRVRGVRLFAGVLTTAKNRKARQAIRESWGSHPELHRFFLLSSLLFAMWSGCGALACIPAVDTVGANRSFCLLFDCLALGEGSSESPCVVMQQASRPYDAL